MGVQTRTLLLGVYMKALIFAAFGSSVALLTQSMHALLTFAVPPWTGCLELVNVQISMSSNRTGILHSAPLELQTLGSPPNEDGPLQHLGVVLEDP